VYATDKELWEIIGKKRAKKLEFENLNAGLKVIRKLNSSGLQTIAVTGNWDPAREKDIGQGRSKWKLYEQDLLRPSIRKFKNFKIVNNRALAMDDFIFVGYPRSTYPGFSSMEKRNKLEKNGFPDKEVEKELERIRKDYARHYKKLDSVFKKAKQKRKPIIFISHNCPYKTRLDLISAKKAHELAKGKHYGSFLTRKMIEKYRPLLCICGHMHENQGQCKIGKTFVINPGPSFRGKYSIININRKIGVRFKR
jgi:Icc-related predicted phosphoesterase